MYRFIMRFFFLGIYSMLYYSNAYAFYNLSIITYLRVGMYFNFPTSSLLLLYF